MGLLDRIRKAREEESKDKTMDEIRESKGLQGFNKKEED
jgi:hypothetical protein